MEEKELSDYFFFLLFREFVDNRYFLRVVVDYSCNICFIGIFDNIIYFFIDEIFIDCFFSYYILF